MKISTAFVYGASGHGKVVADILLSAGKHQLAGFIDDNPAMKGATVLGLPVLGDGAWLERESRSSRIGVALGVGDNYLRQMLFSRCLNWNIEPLTLVHPTAAISQFATLELGAVVMAHATINPGARIARGAIVNTGAVIEHDVQVGEFAHVAPNAAMGGASSLGCFSMVAMGAVLIQCIKVGNGTTIGAGAVVVRNIPDGCVAFGVPARVVRNYSENNSANVNDEAPIRR
ncbi:MAG TPA: acetyltransferase [Dongiaceae bacterium]|nr:acetyltransferase [Dongiaceae bacterium]